MAIGENTKLFFKYGSQENYKNLKAKDAGTFYVTSDTHRLYLGSDLLSQAVLVVATTKELPGGVNGTGIDPGQIAYVIDGNILCIKRPATDDLAEGWTQLNPNTDTTIKSIQHVVSNVVNGNAATLKTSLTDSKENSIETANPVSIKGDAASGILVSADGSAITIKNSPLAVKDVTDGIQLGFSDSNNVVLKGDGVTTVNHTENAITIRSTDTKVTSGTLAAAPKASGFGITASVTQSNGTESNTINLGTEGGVTIDPIIAIGKAGESTGTSTTRFANGTATLDVYTTKQVDDAIDQAKQTMNAMTYKGKVGGADGIKALPTTGVAIGDTYIVGAPNGYQIAEGSPIYPLGTLIIAKAKSGVTEDDKGFLPANGVDWDAVKTSDIDTTYTLVPLAGDKKIQLKSSVEGNDSTLQFVGDAAINVAIGGSNTTPTVTLTHTKHIPTTTENPTAITQTTGKSAKVTYLSGLTFDAFGHVATMTTTDATLLDTVNTKFSILGSVTTANKEIKLGFSLQDSAKNTVENAIKVKSETLQITASNETSDPKNAVVSADIVWGTF